MVTLERINVILTIHGNDFTHSLPFSIFEKNGAFACVMQKCYLHFALLFKILK